MDGLFTGKTFGYLYVAIGAALLIRPALSAIRSARAEAHSAKVEPDGVISMRRVLQSVVNDVAPAASPTEAVSQPVPVETPPARKQKPVAHAPLEEHEGVLLAAGFAKREYGYSSYRLSIQSDALGTPLEIWGIDLKRALEISGANIGDRIRASLTGHIATSVDGGDRTARKKIWNVTKLE